MWLSHPWGPSCPAYGGGAKIELQPAQSMAHGGTSNSLKFIAGNHIGTHMDAPRHFVHDGRTVDSYTPQECCFYRPCIVDVRLTESDRHIVANDLSSLSDTERRAFEECDLLLFRTGAEGYRDQERYWRDGPGLGLGLADYIRQHAPNCRAVGIDAISITAFSNRDLGRQVHREFLGGVRPLFLIEDMALSRAKSLVGAIVAPLRVEQGDGAPVTVIGYQS